MITEKTKIAGKTVNLAYCIATELAFEDMTKPGNNLSEAIVEAAHNITEGREPNLRTAIVIILAAHLAYNQAKDIEEPAVIDKDLMTKATKEEIGTALGLTIAMWGKFYKIGTGDVPKSKTTKGKTRKN